MDFPLIKELGLAVENVLVFERSSKERCVYYVRASELERVLEQGVRVSGCDRSTRSGRMFWDQIENTDTSTHTHTALLINIKEIKQDTAEDLLRELVSTDFRSPGSGHSKLDPLLERARALLEKSDGK
jgi:hypothetical protein